VNVASASPALIPALASLEVVTLLTKAMSAVNASAVAGGALPGPVGGYCDRFERAGYCVKHICYKPRLVITPTPRYLPRPVITPTPCFAESTNPDKPMCPIAPGPLPWWKLLPWQTPAAPAPIVKVISRPPDMLTRGTMIDFFC
jgi:hypothetical protein